MSEHRLKTVYAPTYENNGVLYELPDVKKDYGFYIIHNNEYILINENLVFENTPENKKALETLYPKFSFDDDVYLYDSVALDRLLIHDSPILCTGKIHGASVYVNVESKQNNYFIDDFNREWVELTPVEIDSYGHITKKRVLKYGN